MAGTSFKKEDEKDGEEAACKLRKKTKRQGHERGNRGGLDEWKAEKAQDKSKKKTEKNSLPVKNGSRERLQNWQKKRDRFCRKGEKAGEKRSVSWGLGLQLPAIGATNTDTAYKMEDKH